MIDDYRVVSEVGSLNDFQVSVTNAIDNGWRPIGGVMVLTTPRGLHYFQAMVKVKANNARKNH